MKVVTPSYTILSQATNDMLMYINNMYKHIEACGRTCYKSDDKITDDSYDRFVTQVLMGANHGAMLEHGTLYLTIQYVTSSVSPDNVTKERLIEFFKRNKYSIVNSELVKNEEDGSFSIIYYITTNMRVIYENKEELFPNQSVDDKELAKHMYEAWARYLTAPTDNHEQRYTVIFTCDIGVSREYNRHRTHSIAEESTRYCNYSKDKFDGMVNICKPSWIDDSKKEIIADPVNFYNLCYHVGNFEDDGFDEIDYWTFANMACEYSYMNLLKLGWTPQKARTVLPLDTKTTLVHTATATEWAHFFKLRALGATGTPHPSAKELAEPLMKEFLDKKYITQEMLA